jgi:hypothetical protein
LLLSLPKDVSITLGIVLSLFLLAVERPLLVGEAAAVDDDDPVLLLLLLDDRASRIPGKNCLPPPPPGGATQSMVMMEGGMKEPMMLMMLLLPQLSIIPDTQQPDVPFFVFRNEKEDQRRRSMEEGERQVDQHALWMLKMTRKRKWGGDVLFFFQPIIGGGIERARYHIERSNICPTQPCDRAVVGLPTSSIVGQARGVGSLDGRDVKDVSTSVDRQWALLVTASCDRRAIVLYRPVAPLARAAR